MIKELIRVRCLLAGPSNISMANEMTFIRRKFVENTEI